MPVARLSRRRRSSLAIASFTPAKPGVYGINKPVQFAPNVTPVSYANPEEDDFDLEMLSSTALFPPSEVASAPAARRRGRRRSSGHIPRPPNAFMLFRKDFVRQKHVPGSIEANHGSLSKIIGNCWRQLPLEEKRVWEQRARLEKLEHQKAFPNYKFKPIHNKAKKELKKKKGKSAVLPEEEARCEEVAQLLLEGMKGEELAEAVRALDLKHRTPTTVDQSAALRQTYGQRRPSSVPLPISIPTLPFFGSVSAPRNVSPADNPGLYIRRASSVQPQMFYHPSLQFPFDGLMAPSIHLDTQPLPDIQTTFSNPFNLGTIPEPFTFAPSANDFGLAPHELPFTWPSALSSDVSFHQPSSSASPASSVSPALPGPSALPVFAPQPIHPAATAPHVDPLSTPVEQTMVYPEWGISVADAGQGDIDVALFGQGMLDPSSAMPATFLDGCGGMFDTPLAADQFFNGFSFDQPTTTFM